MIRREFSIVIISISFSLLPHVLFAQDTTQANDGFFLARKKGILGRIGRSISVTSPDQAPQKLENPFLKFKGKIIRSIETVQLGFEYDFNDTTQIKNNLGIRVGKIFHKNTKENVVR